MSARHKRPPVPKGKAPVLVYLPPELAKKLRVRAAEKGISNSAVAQAALESYL